MNTRAIALLTLSLLPFLPRQESPAQGVTSTILEAEGDELVLVQEAWFDAPVADLWRAYTTAEGMRSWAAPAAEVDLRIGGEIRTNYLPGKKVGEEGTNTVHVLAYVPERLLTLQAEPSPLWPESLRAEADRFSNVILFEALGDERSHVVSYGIGYRDVEEHRKLLEFFLPANEGLLRTLQQVLAAEDD